MDAQAYLLRHGWSGPGNPLNPNRRPGTHGGLGLTRPILVARRQGNQGVGKKTTKDHTNQWWLRGFEDALKGVGEENKAGGAGETKRAPNALTSELYRFFVRGETVPGTLGGVKDKKEGEEAGKRKREGDEMEVDGKQEKRRKGEEKGKKESKEERRLRREEKKKRKEERAKRKEERRKRREAKEVRRAERRENKEKKRLLKEKKKNKEERRPEEEYPTPPATELEQTESSGRDESVVQEVKAKKESKSKSKKREASTSDDGSKKKSKKSKDEKKSAE